MYGSLLQNRSIILYRFKFAKITSEISVFLKLCYPAVEKKKPDKPSGFIREDCLFSKKTAQSSGREKEEN